MTIINKNSNVFIENDSSIIQRCSPIVNLDEYRDRDYWLIEVFNEESVNNLHKTISDEIINAIIYDNLYLLISNTHEGYHNIVTSLYYKVILEWGIPENKIILASESADVFTVVREVSNRLGRQPIESWWTRVFEYDASHTIVSDNKSLPLLNNVVNRVYNKKFLCFNRYWRPWRPALVALLKIKKVLDKGYVSLPFYADLTWELQWHNIIESQPTRPDNELVALLQEHKDEIFKIPALQLDHDHVTISRQLYEVIGSTDVQQLYRDSYFSVITETNFITTNWRESSNGRILSEKTFKAISNNHPFILVSIPFSLQALRECGYKTFSGIIDESYDLEKDDSTRLLMISDEIVRLSNLDQTQLTQFLEHTYDICKYNYNLLRSRSSSFDFITKTKPMIDLNLVYHKERKPRLSKNDSPVAASSVVSDVIVYNSLKIPKGLLINKNAIFRDIAQRTAEEPAIYYEVAYASSLIDSLSEEQWLNLKNNPDDIFIYDCCQESIGHIEIVVDAIKKIVFEYQVIESQIYILLLDRLHVHHLKRNLAVAGIFDINIDYLNVNLKYHTTTQYLNNKIPNYKFSLLSRAYKTSRLHFFCELIKEKVIDQCNYTFHNLNLYDSQYPVGQVPFEILKNDAMMYYAESKDDIEAWMKKIPYSIGDIGNISDHHTYDFICTADIHVVLETRSGLGYDISLITEKLFKSIICKKPFLVYGTSLFLQDLKKEGYKSFAPYINEDYDLISDKAERRTAIVAEMKRIANLPNDEYNILISNCAAITEYNYELLHKNKSRKLSVAFEALQIFKNF